MEEALKLYKEALALNSKIDDESKMGSNLVNIGIIFLAQFKTKEAIEYFLKALEIFKKYHRNTGIVVVSHQLLLACNRLGNKELADEIFNQIETIATSRDGSYIQGLYLLSKAIKFKNPTD